MRGWLIDRDGTVLTQGSSELYARFGYPSPDFNLLAYAVRNLGCVHLQEFAGALRVRAWAGTIGRATFDAAFKLLLGEDYQRYVFEVGRLAPSLEIIGNYNDAVARLEDLLEPGDARERPAPVICEELSLSRLRHPKRVLLCRLIKEWKRARGELGADPLTPFSESGTAQRTVLVRLDANDRARIAFFGPRLDVFDAEWASRAVGLDIEDQPDPVYGASAGRAYHEVGIERRPRLELVDALIDAPGRPQQRSRYERLLLPWRAAGGETYVSAASVLRTRVAIGDAR